MRPTMANTDPKNFAEKLIARTADVLPPGPIQNQLRHQGTEMHTTAMLIATMIELSQQPGLMSDKARPAAEAAARAGEVKPAGK